MFFPFYWTRNALTSLEMLIDHLRELASNAAETIKKESPCSWLLSLFSVADMFPKGGLRKRSQGFSEATNDVETPGKMGLGKVGMEWEPWGQKGLGDKVQPSEPRENKKPNHWQIQDIFMQRFLTSQETRLSEGLEEDLV